MAKIVPQLKSAPTPLAPYSVVTEAGGLLFISGQVPMGIDDGATPDGIEAQTELVMANIGTLLSDLGLGFDDVVKTTIFLTDMDDYGTVNEIYGRAFETEPPARSAVGVAALPKPEFLIEVELIAAR
ncbi:MAG: reactive intermediate/imine deaminase [Acidimicrobiia bacterium]|nr:reactive intermediate/imine deaminase [Acidimicrobiia bacterium]